MNITYNNLANPSNIITFTDIPNILKITEENYGTKAHVRMGLTSAMYGATTTDGQWKITFLGETITNVIDPAGAINKLFTVMPSANDTAYSVARAFRNCPTIAANYNVSVESNVVVVTNKIVGEMFTNGFGEYFETNIPSNYMLVSDTDGSTNAQLYQSKIDVDIYAGWDNEYVTTLEKNFYDGECAFNLSPVLTTFAKIGSAVPYTFDIKSVGGLERDGVISQLGTISGNYVSVGYMVNQGAKYLDNTFMQVAQNFYRGTPKETANNMPLYLYEQTIPISFYRGNTGGMTITVEYKDSAFNTFYTQNVATWQSHDSSRNLIDLYGVHDWGSEISLLPYVFNTAYYIDVHLGNIVIRYNVIKPLQTTEYSQRILWRNSYGGISFFDFTGQRTETRDFELSTYQKNIYDYYTDEKNELEKIYDNEVKYSVTLKSHLFEHDGKYIFNDLIQSPEVWTTINGEKYAIILDSVSVDEVNQNNVYEATVKYHYSQEPSLI